jgi:hypothetical protein
VENDNGFNWCALGYAKNTHPTSMDTKPTYNLKTRDGRITGGDNTGRFCFVFSKAKTSASLKKWIWCTETGCKKEGF